MIKDKKFPYNLELGDIIEYDINVNYVKTGETKKFTIDSQELLNNIQRFEDENNWHNMRVVDHDSKLAKK